MADVSKEHRGFASMDEANRREVARRGGRAAHQLGKAHEWTREEAREAGRKGGGILLRSGDDSIAPSASAVASALEELATTLDLASRDHGFTARAGVIDSMRRSVAQMSAAIGRMEKRHA